MIEVEVAAVLQEGATHGHRALVVERRAVDQEGGHAVEAEAVVQPVGVFGVLLVDDVGNHDVADAAVQRRRLAQEVDTPQRLDADRDLAQDVVGPQTKRIVDVDQHRRAALQSINRRVPQAGVEVAGDQPVEDDDLRRDVEASLAGKEEDAALFLLAAPLRPPLPGLR